ncbi:MAG: dienelactone hydrolase family protein [Streptosporangiales bacterium]
MTVTTRRIRVAAHGRGAMPALLAEPGRGSGPGILLLHEIFGITDYIHRRATALAEAGYVTLVPDLYWRLGDDVVIDEGGEGALEVGLDYRQRLDFGAAVDDAVAALEYLDEMEESLGRGGVLGFCLGAGIAFGVAVHADPVTAVFYYGSDIPGQLARAHEVRSPALFHWGGDDDYVPAEARAAVDSAFSGRTDVETHVYPGASHAFDNDVSPLFSRPEQAAEAWQRTEDFLARTLPVGNIHWQPRVD